VGGCFVVGGFCCVVFGVLWFLCVVCFFVGVFVLGGFGGLVVVLVFGLGFVVCGGGGGWVLGGGFQVIH